MNVNEILTSNKYSVDRLVAILDYKSELEREEVINNDNLTDDDETTLVFGNSEEIEELMYNKCKSQKWLDCIEYIETSNRRIDKLPRDKQQDVHLLLDKKLCW